MKMINAIDFSHVRRAAVILSSVFFRRHLTGVYLIATLTSFTLAGCISSAEQKDRWTFTCPDGYEFVAVYSVDGTSVTLEDESRKLNLDIEQSASGARYTNGTAVFWSKGVMARVDYGEGLLHQDCQGYSD